ncbi:MAG: sulfatase-like hydrolase/transferase [Elusimicrobiota bacterium]
MIDVCVSTHDNLRDLPAVLDALFAQRGVLKGRVRVIDNGSTDGGPQWIRRERRWVEVVELGRNGGPSASRNAALREPGAPWVLMLDGDCSLAPGCIEALLLDRANNPAEAYSARVVYADDPGRIYYDAGTAHFLGLLCMQNAHVPASQALPPARDPGAVSTSALLVSREAALRAGLFDEGYFFFGEDLDFSLRLRALGGRLRHVPEAVVLHHKPLPGSSAAALERSRRRWCRSFRQGPNRWRTLLKVCRAGTLLRTSPMHLTYESVEALNALREACAWAHLRGLLGFMMDLPRVLRQRRGVQSSRRIEDSELFGNPTLGWRPEIREVAGARILQRALERACGFFWSASAALLFLSLSASITRASLPSCPDCSLVVIGLDDVRADRVAPSVGKPGWTPRLDRFAADAVVFTQAVSPAPWTLPAFVSLFTALHPSRHGVVNRYSDFSSEPPILARLSQSCPGARTLTEVLRGKGLRTAAFTGGAGLTGVYGLASGFEVYEDSVTFGGFGRSVTQALSWLDSRKTEERFFLFVHGYDAHGFNSAHFPQAEDKLFRARRNEGIAGAPPPSTPRERHLRRRRYGEALRRLDKNLAPLLDRLDRPDLRGRVLVVVVGDHGEELFEHGGIDHGLTLYDELLRVPLLLRVPGVKGRRVNFQVRTLDVMPTILDLMGMTPDPELAAQMEGVSLLPALRGEKMSLDAFAETDFLLHVSLRGLRTFDGWKAVYDRHSQATRLFRLSSDPAERHDLAASETTRRLALEERILQAFDQEPLVAQAQGSVEGRLKKVHENSAIWVFDLWTDPMRGRKWDEPPAPVQPKVFEQRRQEGSR